jgi:hypothetical protein
MSVLLHAAIAGGILHSFPNYAVSYLRDHQCAGMGIYFYRNIINRDDLRCNYVCSLVLRQTLADCDTVASSRCQDIKTENGNLCEEWKYELLGTSRNLRKATVTFANHVRLSVRSHETTRPPLEEFPLNFKMRRNVKSVEKHSLLFKIVQTEEVLYLNHCKHCNYFGYSDCYDCC